MHLRAKYWRNVEQKCRCSLTVMDKGDLTSDNIFSGATTIHPNVIDSLSGRYNATIVTGNDWIDLKAKVHACIDRIGSLICDWRDKDRPVTEDFNI